MKKKIKAEVVAEETVVETPVTEEVVKVMKPKMTLKRKLIIGGGVLAGLILGAVALSMKKQAPEAGEETNLDGTEEEELIAMEEAEAEAAELTQTEF